MLTAQQVFDKVATHLFAQGEPALRESGRIKGKLVCAYRAPGDLKCAAGCLLPDELYDPCMEGDTLAASAVSDVFAQVVRKRDLPLLSSLQNVHDLNATKFGSIEQEQLLSVERPTQWESTAAMRNRLAVIACSYQLDAAILATLSFGDR